MADGGFWGGGGSGCREGVDAEGGVADDFGAGAGGVAGVSEVKEAEAEAFFAGQPGQAVDRGAATGLIAIEAGVEGEDAFCSVGIDAAGDGIGQIVREIRAYDEKRLGPAPQGIEDGADLLGGGVADQERHDADGSQHFEQERKLHFQAVLGDVGLGAVMDEAGVGAMQKVEVDIQAAKRRLEASEAGACHRGDICAMGGPDQDNALDLPAQRRKQAIGGRGDGPGIDIPGMRHKNSLGRCGGRIGRWLVGLDVDWNVGQGGRGGIREQALHLGPQRIFFAGIEHAGDSGRAAFCGAHTFNLRVAALRCKGRSAGGLG